MSFFYLGMKNDILRNSSKVLNKEEQFILDFIINKMALDTKYNLSAIKNKEAFERVFTYIMYSCCDRLIGRVIKRDDITFWKEACPVMERNAVKLQLSLNFKKENTVANTDGIINTLKDKFDGIYYK